MKTLKNGVILLALLLAAMAIVPIVSAYQASNYQAYYTMSEGGSLNTKPHGTMAASNQSTMGYSASTYSDIFNSNCALDSWNRMASDQVFYYAGHGGPGFLRFKDQTILHASGSLNPRLSGYSTQLQDLALAVYDSCESATTNSTDGGNLLDESYNRGIDTSVGFSAVLWQNQANYWSDQFWGYLRYGYNVDYAVHQSIIDTRIAFNYNFGGVDSHVIRGNQNLVINPARAGS